MGNNNGERVDVLDHQKSIKVTDKFTKLIGSYFTHRADSTEDCEDCYSNEMNDE